MFDEYYVIAKRVRRIPVTHAANFPYSEMIHHIYANVYENDRDLHFTERNDNEDVQSFFKKFLTTANVEVDSRRIEARSCIPVFKVLTDLAPLAQSVVLL